MTREMCSLETFPFQNANGNDEMIIIIADKRPIQKRPGREIVPMLRKGDLDIFFNRRPMTPGHLRSWTHERSPPRNLDDRDMNEFANVLGTIAEDQNISIPGYMNVLLVSHRTWMTWKRTKLRTYMV